MTRFGGHPLGVSILFPLVVLACKGDKGGDSNGEQQSCNVEILNTVPADGDALACHASAIEFSIAGGDPNGTITVTDGSGASVAGTTEVNEDGTYVTFTPNAPLEPSSPYTATLEYCLGTETVSFTTSAHGEPLADPSALVDQVYVINLREARFVKPEGVAAILQTQLTRNILLWVRTGTDGTTLEATLAIAADGGTGTEQDLCAPTVDFPSGSLTGPSWTLGPADLELSVAGEPVTVADLQAGGTFAPDGSSFGCGTITGLVDTRPLVPAIGEPDSPPEFICELVEDYGATCEACPDGKPLCLLLEVDQLTAPAAKGAKLVDITETCPKK